MKKTISLVLAAAMVTASIPVSFAADDITNHWAETYIKYLNEEEIMNPSASTGLYEPSRAVTRAEFMRYINRTYHFTESTAINFSDVSSSSWYYENVQIAVKHGYITGMSETTMNPTGYVTREQAATIIGRLYKGETQNVKPQDLNFTDNAQISEWSAPWIKAAVDAGILTGYSDGTFRPKATITRAEVAKILYFYMGTNLSKEGQTYTASSLKTDTNNVTISEPCTLSGCTINGDLYISEGTLAGTVTLSDVTVHGTIVQSGGQVVLRNVTADDMILSTATGRVLHTTASGSTNIAETTAYTSAILSASSLTGAGLESVIVRGDEAPTITVSTPLKQFTAETPATVSLPGSIAKLTANAALTLTGSGIIQDAVINAGGVSLSVEPTTYTIRSGLTASIAGQTVSGTKKDESIALSKTSLSYDLGDTLDTYYSFSISAGDSANIKKLACDEVEMVEDEDYALTTSAIRIYGSFLKTLSVGSHTIVVTAKDGSTVTIKLTVTNENGNSISITTASFDTYTKSAGYENITTTLETVNQATLKKIVLGATSIPYTASGSKVTINKSSLQDIYPGVYTLTFVMSKGINPTMTLKVTSSGTNSSVSDNNYDFSGSYTFGDSYARVTITNYGSQTVSKVKCDGNTLSKQEDYYSTLKEKNKLNLTIYDTALDEYESISGTDYTDFDVTLSNGDSVVVRIFYE